MSGRHSGKEAKGHRAVASSSAEGRISGLVGLGFRVLSLWSFFVEAPVLRIVGHMQIFDGRKVRATYGSIPA